MTRFFASDYHFFHENIIKYGHRPFSNLQEMHQTLIANWNQTVSSSDTVYFLGDFAFGDKASVKEICQQLNGHKILIKGNHDRTNKEMQDIGFNEVYTHLRLNLEGQEVNLSHYPYQNEAFKDKHHHKKLVDKGLWLIHGHVHQVWHQRGRMINVSAEVINYTPVSEAYLVKLISAGPRND